MLQQVRIESTNCTYYLFLKLEEWFTEQAKELLYERPAN